MKIFKAKEFVQRCFLKRQNSLSKISFVLYTVHLVKNAILGYCELNGVKSTGTSPKSVHKTIAMVLKPKIKHIEIRVPKPYFEKYQNCRKFCY